MKRLTRIVATIVAGLYAVMALPGTAFAHTEPIRPESSSVPITSPDPYQAPAADVSSSGWGLALVVAAVVAVLAAAVVVAGQRAARRRRGARSPALGV